MDHRAIIASLTADQRARLTETSNRAGLLHLSAHWGLILALGLLIGMRIPWWPLLMVPQGILIVFNFTLLHEAVHRTPFRSQWLNDGIARIAGLSILLPADWFRYFHFAHHRYTQDPENDPELASAKPETVGQYLCHVSGIPIWWGAIRGLGINATGRGAAPYIPAKGEAKIIREARAMIMFYALVAAISVFLGSDVLIFAWVLPAILGQPFLRLYLLAEHGRCPFVANMLENSRTTYTTFVVRKLAWNMPFHAEHHSYPGVPFYRLPEFHALIESRLKVTERGYLRFNRHYLSSLRR